MSLSVGEQARLRKRQTHYIEAWECFGRASPGATVGTRPNMHQAREFLERAVTLDPNFAVAWVVLGRVHWQDARAHWTNTPEKSLDRAAECAERALAIDSTYADSHANIGLVRLFQRRFAEAVAAGEKAVELGASSAETYILLAQTLNYVDRAPDAVALIERAMRLFRYYPDHFARNSGALLPFARSIRGIDRARYRASQKEPRQYVFGLQTRVRLYGTWSPG